MKKGSRVGKNKKVDVKKIVYNPMIFNYALSRENHVIEVIRNKIEGGEFMHGENC